MKDYRRIKRYYSNEWENDVEWKAQRLSFLWDIRRVFNSIYMHSESGTLEDRLCNEKEDFYRESDGQVSTLATKFNNGTYSRDIEYYKKYSIENLYKHYERLSEMRSSKNLDLLRKNNLFLYLYIEENRLDEIQEYKELIRN